MAGKRTLFDDAMANYEAAFFMWPLAGVDSQFPKLITEHLNLAVVFAIEYLLGKNEAGCPENCDVEKLIEFAEENDTDIYLTEYIKDNTRMLSDWGNKTKSETNVDLELLDTALKEIDEYLKLVRENEIM